VPLDQRFVSFAQAAEDVVLWRTLRHIPTGRYVEVGANDPTSLSITRAFYDRGWRGIEIEPVTEFVEAFRNERPEDVVVQAAVTDADVDTITLHVVDGTGLSTLDDDIKEVHRSSGWETRDEVVPARRLDDILGEHLKPSDEIHFMVVDTEGSERAVLASVDLRRWRPWVLVVESTSPLSNTPTHDTWEHLVTEAGYEFCLFDGLSRFYVAEEHARALRPALVTPANPIDDYVTHREVQLQRAAERLQAERDDLLGQLLHWRGVALQAWSDGVAEATGLSAQGGAGHEIARLRAELEALQQTLSWRITQPLRTVRSRQLRGTSHS
jgi:FkbM family methyltransferase